MAGRNSRYPEAGANDFQISHGPSEFSSGPPAVAYNSRNNEYLVVWRGYDGSPLESEVWGQRIDAASGAGVGIDDFRISDMGTDGDKYRAAQFPCVVYAGQTEDYLVAWLGDDVVDGFNKVYGQLITSHLMDIFIGN